MLRRHFDVAEELLVRHGLTLRLRTLDALHLAVALDLQKANAIDVLVSADMAMVAVARAEGLTVTNPLEP